LPAELELKRQICIIVGVVEIQSQFVMHMKKFSILTFALFLSLFSDAQSKPKGSIWPNGDAKRWMIGIQGGTSTLHGDARQMKFGYAAGLHAQYSFSHVFGIRMLGNIGQLTGAEKPEGRPYSRYDFTNDFWEGQAQMVFTLGNISYLRKARKMNLYLAGGLGWFNSDATSTYVLKSDASNTERTDTYKEGHLAFSFSSGLRYTLSPAMALGLEYNFRYMGSDLVDVLQYPSSGNKSKDAASILQLTLGFKLGKKGKEHVEWINPVESMYEDIARMEKKVDALSGDKDGDGVADYFDKDNETPSGANVYGNGKPVDTDGDGVPDYKDTEPNSPSGARVDENGKAEDSDNDGVPDVLDLSPNTDTAYMVNHQGIPIMTKELARKLAPKGGLGSGGIGYMPAILFETASSRVKPTSYVDLQGIAEAIKRTPGVKILLIGNADYRGSEHTNDRLALQRAEAVKKILVENFGVDANLLLTQSNGEKVPIARGTDPVSLQANRRVQFFVVE
jgi:outer membrane protein OmpA-like peptidoglycan-associated protein/opacity protein-like surface antigen